MNTPPTAVVFPCHEFDLKCQHPILALGYLDQCHVFFCIVLALDLIWMIVFLFTMHVFLHMFWMMPPFVSKNVLCLNSVDLSTRICQFDLAISISPSSTGTLILARLWRTQPLNSVALYSPGGSFRMFLSFAFAIGHDSQTGNDPCKRIIPRYLAVILVVSSLRCPRYSWAH